MRIGFIFCVIVLMGCSKKELLDKKKMQAVLWDVIQADVYTTQFLKIDSVVKDNNIENVKLQKQIFTIHNTTKEEFYKSYTYYQEHPKMLQEIFDSISVQQQRKEREKYLKSIKKK
ncbi:MAG: DUF4296 domain-containing protein [Bacteroidota bacterium]